MTPIGSIMMSLLPLDGLRPSPDEGRRWAEEELAKPMYQESLLSRFKDWLFAQLSKFFNFLNPENGEAAVPGALILLAVVVIIAVVAFLLIKARRGRASSTPDDPVPVLFDEVRLSAAAYRALCQEALSRGDTRRAFVEGYRALAAGLIERHLLDPAPDQTCREFTAQAVAMFPQQEVALGRATTVFEETVYGGHTPGGEQVQNLIALDQQLQKAEAVRPDLVQASRPLAVPR